MTIVPELVSSLLLPLSSSSSSGASGSSSSWVFRRVLDVQQAADDVAADGALIGLRLELVRTSVTHAHMAAGQRRRVAGGTHADDTPVEQ